MIFDIFNKTMNMNGLNFKYQKSSTIHYALFTEKIKPPGRAPDLFLRPYRGT